MSSPRTERRVGILLAVREELGAVCARMKPVSVEEAGGIPFYTGELAGFAVVAARSGMGFERAGRMAELVIERYSPCSLIIAGFCAGLDPALHPGDVVRASASSPVILTVPSIATTAAEKRALVAAHPRAAALDMETAGAARAAEAAGIPWFAIRAVTDGLDDDMPLDFSRFTGPDGETDRLRVALHALAHPARIPALIRLGSRSALAARNLAVAVESYVEQQSRESGVESRE